MAKSLLKSLDNILFKNVGALKEDVDSNKNLSVDRKWLKEATMSRVTDRIMNELSNLTSTKGFNITPDKLDESGLSENEILLLTQWVSGIFYIVFKLQLQLILK